jgi:hypothetical protein
VSSKPFDVTLKDLVEFDAPGWVSLLGHKGARSAELIDADVSTVIAAADKVIRVRDAGGEWLLDLEPTTSHAGDLPERLQLYGSVLRNRHGLPVRSVALLLRREANATNLTGVLELRFPDEADPYLVFRYRVVRVWELPLKTLLEGGLGTLPLAPLTDEAAPDLPDVVAKVAARLRQELPHESASKHLTTTFILLGLRYPIELADRLHQEVLTMEESTTYQWIVRRGRLQEARTIILQLGHDKFGPPDEAATAALERITDIGKLETLSRRVLTVNSWEELLTEQP